ncbi:hypothetical protein TELCIR_13669, partial [Teladorsagia circumcincta]
MNIKKGYCNIFPVYAPQAGCPEIKKDEFYLRPDDAIRSTPDGDYLTIAGDPNGHVSTDRRSVER